MPHLVLLYNVYVPVSQHSDQPNLQQEMIRSIILCSTIEPFIYGKHLFCSHSDSISILAAYQGFSYLFVIAIPEIVSFFCCQTWTYGRSVSVRKEALGHRVSLSSQI